MAKNKGQNETSTNINKEDAEIKAEIQRLRKNVTLKKEFEAWIHKKVNMLFGEMMVDFVKYKINFCYNESFTNDADIGTAVFTIKPVKKYKRALITVYDEALYLYQHGEENELIDGLVHELTHIHTTPLSELACGRYSTKKEIIDTTEELTELMAEYIRRLIRLRNKGIYNN
jgi:hypothetical protein